MKKLMMFAAAVTIAGSALAVDVLDYKATVYNLNLKAVRIRVTDSISGASSISTVAVKYKTTSSLFGYVITECGNCIDEDGQAYLVVANRANRIVGILPADLLVKTWPANGDTNSKSWLAEGYLFAGCGKIDHPWGAYDEWGTCDYGNSTEKLFGNYNRESEIGDFADAWLDAAGFGKAVYVSGASGDLCSESGSPCMLLDSLSGYLIGGMFLCAESHGEEFLCNPWSATTDVVTGAWSVKRNTRLQPVTPEQDYENTLGDSTVDAYVNAAIKAISKTSTFDSVVPSVDDGPDFERIAD
jgi:hypothetical protein